MSNLVYQYVANRFANARRITQGGREWFVAPAVSIIGDWILPGSQGSLLYPSAECARNVKAWDGIPVTAYHPMTENGEPVGATYPGVRERQYIGVVKDSVFNGKLRHTLWIDIAKAKQVDPYTNNAGTKIINALERGTALEISSGLYTDNEPTHGTCPKTGRGYTAIARNYVPDHMAVLIGQRGACSVADGCGLLVNRATANANPEGHNQYDRLYKQIHAHADDIDKAAEAQESFGKGDLAAVLRTDAGNVRRAADKFHAVKDKGMLERTLLSAKNVKRYRGLTNTRGPDQCGTGDGG